jgi:hypothetical protein
MSIDLLVLTDYIQVTTAVAKRSGCIDLVGFRGPIPKAMVSSELT